MDDVQNKRVIVRYMEDMAPVPEDPAPHLQGEIVSVRNIAAALQYHPRGEIVGFVGESETLTTEQAKRLLAKTMVKSNDGMEDQPKWFRDIVDKAGGEPVPVRLDGETHKMYLERNPPVDPDDDAADDATVEDEAGEDDGE